jgi:hypothetical protein
MQLEASMAMDSSIVYSNILKIALPWRDFRITLPHSGSSVSKGKMALRSLGICSAVFFVWPTSEAAKTKFESNH